MKHAEDAYMASLAWIASLDTHIIGVLQVMVFLVLIIFILFDVLKN